MFTLFVVDPYVERHTFIHFIYDTMITFNYNATVPGRPDGNNRFSHKTVINKYTLLIKYYMVTYYSYRIYRNIVLEKLFSTLIMFMIPILKRTYNIYK